MIIVLLSSATGYYYFIECLNILKFTQVSNETNITLFDKYNNGGEKVKIAILDSGVNLNHRDFSGNIKSGYDFINNQAMILLIIRKRLVISMDTERGLRE